MCTLMSHLEMCYVGFWRILFSASSRNILIPNIANKTKHVLFHRFVDINIRWSDMASQYETKSSYTRDLVDIIRYLV